MIGDFNSVGPCEAVKDLVSEFPADSVDGLDFDIGNETSIKNAVNRMLHRYGRFDILVNATCYSAGKRVEEVTGEDFNKSIQVNITGSFLLARAAAQAMKHGGGIIMFSSFMTGQVLCIDGGITSW